jgi:hypothetical protein
MHIERSSLKTENFMVWGRTAEAFIPPHERLQSNFPLLNFAFETDFIVKRLKTLNKSSAIY